jgi:putative FmdB family regulatory protein
MAIYEYYCQSCKTKFERRRPMSQATVAEKCQCGSQAERSLSMFAAPRGDGDAMFDMSEMGGGGGGCCGGGACGCGANN